jgi:hypothetical protein
LNPYRFLMRLLTGATVAIALQASPAFAQSANTDAALRFKAPAPVRMAYDVKGVISSPYTGSAELLWDHDGKRYQSELLIRKFGLTLQKWTSQGSVGQRGLEPDKFTSKRLGQSEISASFQRAAGRVSFSEGSPDASLQNGAQDQLSVFMHLAGLLGGLGSTGAAGKSLGLQAIGDKYAEQWSFLMGAAETIALPSGSVQAIPFTHEPTAERKQRLEIWYAPSLQFLPVRIRITESNGDYLDLVWANSQNR